MFIHCLDMLSQRFRRDALPVAGGVPAKDVYPTLIK